MSDTCAVCGGEVTATNSIATLDTAGDRVFVCVTCIDKARLRAGGVPEETTP